MNKSFLLISLLSFAVFTACNNKSSNGKTPITNDITDKDTFDNSANGKLVQSFIDKDILKCNPEYYSVVFSTINVADVKGEKDFRHTKFKRAKQCNDGTSSSYISVLYTTHDDGSIKDYAVFNYDGENDFEYSTKFTPDGKSYYCFTNYADEDGSSQICLFDAQNDFFFISDTMQNGEVLIESSLNFNSMEFLVSNKTEGNVLKHFNKIETAN